MIGFKSFVTIATILQTYSRAEDVQENNKLQNDNENSQKCILVGYNLNITIHECATSTFKMNTCLGACPSVHAPNEDSLNEINIYKLKSMMECCKVREYEVVTVALQCVDNNRFSEKLHQFRSATKCSCSRCG